jgi:tetratricopeptide (TPR) repeat protein
MLLPSGIVQYDPLPQQIPSSFMIKCLLAVVFLVVIFFSRSRILIAITLCFLLPLFPTMALFQNNDHAYAARYTYLPAAVPSIAIAVVTVWGYRKLIAKRWAFLKWFVVAVLTACLFFYAVETVHLIGVWKDTGTFWTRIIEVRPMGRAYQERGLYHFSRKEFDLAIADFSQAIEIAFGLGMYNRYNLNVFRGEAFRETGQYAAAVEDFSYAISVAPRPEYFYHRGLALEALGRAADAEADFKRAGAEKGPIEWQ